MSLIYFVRHGESVSNVNYIFNNSLEEDPLTEKGILQAKATAKWLADKPIDALYSSPIPRALETAKLIAEEIKKPIQVLPQLMEFRIGDLQNKTMNDENFFLHDTILNEWKNGLREVSFPGGENHLQLIQRFNEAMRRMVGEHPSGTIAAVGHGGQIIFGLKAICPNASWEPVWGRIMSNCAITHAEISLFNHRLVGRLDYWANADHLPRELVNSKILSGRILSKWHH